MKIQLNTDKNISGTASLESFVSEKTEHALKHFSDKITRVEIHLSDQNGEKGGANDVQCKIEARVQGAQPVMVMAKSDAKEIALDDALDKLKAVLGSMLGKMKA